MGMCEKKLSKNDEEITNSTEKEWTLTIHSDKLADCIWKIYHFDGMYDVILGIFYGHCRLPEGSNLMPLPP